jgi:hypothetical protein
MTRPTATGSRALDVVLIAGGIVWLLATSGPLRVYYEVTPARIRVSRVHADGTRETIETPAPLRGVGDGLGRARHRLLEFRASPAGRALERPGTRLEWWIEYSKDSPRLDRIEVVP